MGKTKTKKRENIMRQCSMCQAEFAVWLDNEKISPLKETQILKNDYQNTVKDNQSLDENYKQIARELFTTAIELLCGMFLLQHSNCGHTRIWKIRSDIVDLSGYCKC